MDLLAAALLALGAASLVAFLLCVHDKRQARRGAKRVPENALLGAALLGGSPGLILGMLVARHKTRKASFLLRLALVLALQAALVYAALRLW